MNRTDLDQALRSLDPADRHIDPTGPRAQADLRAILATDPAAGHQPVTPIAPAAARAAGRPGRPARRLTAAAALVAAVTAGVVVLPPLAGGDPAFATWTATPTDLPGQKAPEAAEECRTRLIDGRNEYTQDLGVARPVIAERRGAWTTVVLAGADGFSAVCITDDSDHLFSKAMIGSLGRPADDATPGPRELIATSLGVGAMNAGELSMAAGTAGTDITGIVYRSPVHGNVASTVSEGHFALWLPGDEFQDASSTGVDLDVTYRDGTTTTTRLSL